MLYSVEFFSVDSIGLSNRLSRDTQSLVSKVKPWLRKRLKGKGKELDEILFAIEKIGVSEIPKNTPQPYFDALYAILNVYGEPITVRGLDSFNSCLYLEETGIWPWFDQDKFPFKVPKQKNSPPEFGYASANLLKNEVLPGLDNFETSEECQGTINSLEEIVESVVEDNLDLIAYYSVW